LQHQNLLAPICPNHCWLEFDFDGVPLCTEERDIALPPARAVTQNNCVFTPNGFLYHRQVLRLAKEVWFHVESGIPGGKR
jgi:hypothetical protein